MGQQPALNGEWKGHMSPVEEAALGALIERLDAMEQRQEDTVREIQTLQHIISKQIGDLVSILQRQVSGSEDRMRMAEGMIPLATYKEHIEVYKDTFKFAGKIMATLVLGMAGLLKVLPVIVEHIWR